MSNRSENELGVETAKATLAEAQLAKATLNYWSVARLRQAVSKPVEMPSISFDTFAANQAEVFAQVDSFHELGATLVPPPRAVLARGPAALNQRSSPERHTKRVPNRTIYPYSTVLKMFMTFGNSGSVGSAFIIGKRAVLTAAHCVWANGRFANHILFSPGFHNGSSPLGNFAAVKTTCLREYVQSSGRDLRFDIGACVVDRDFPEELGYAGYAINQVLKPGRLESLGYPAAPSSRFPFNGQELWSSSGDYHFEDDSGLNTTVQRTFAHYNDLTGGCSGGPIFTTGAVPIAIGLNSHYLNNPNGSRQQPPRIHSPFFGDPLQRIIQWLRENGGEPAMPGVLEPRNDADDHSNHEGHQNDPAERDKLIKQGLTKIVEQIQDLILKL